MNEGIIRIGSITYTHNARKALAGAGIRARILKVEPSASRGCAYGLSFPSEDLLSVAAILKQQGITYELLA